MTKMHIVKKNDSLWKISRQYGIDVNELSRINHLNKSDDHSLQIGKALKLPEKTSNSPDSIISVLFRGLDSKVFTPTKVKIMHDGKIFIHKSEGIIKNLMLEINDYSQGLKVWIENHEKKFIEVVDAKMVPLGKKILHIDSRQILLKGGLQTKENLTVTTVSESSLKEKLQKNAASSGKADEIARVDGKPVHMAVTVYTSENLRLHPANEKYREAIIHSAKEHNFTPQALAAIIGAEAAKNKDGSWKENSKAGTSSAAGLTQFLKGTWTSNIATDRRSLLVKENDVNTMSTSALLDKRNIAKYSIDAAALYAVQNFEILKKAGIDINKLDPEDKAKLAYLCHHEGAGSVAYANGAIGVLKGILTEKDAARKLPIQLGKGVKGNEKATELIKRYNGSAKNAYVAWLFGYIDGHINVNHYTINPNKNPRNMEQIASALNGSVPPKPEPKSTQPAPKSAVSATSVNTQNNSPSSAASTVPTTSTTVESWSDPLPICTLRTAKLANIKGATFGMTRKGGTKAHQGIDLATIPGTPIKAVCDGRIYSVITRGAYGMQIILAVDVNDLPEKQRSVTLKAQADLKVVYFFYAHLSHADVEADDHVKTGEIIGKSGSTGNAEGMITIADGAHLHFETRIKPAGPLGLTNRIDPLPFLENCTNISSLHK